MAADPRGLSERIQAEVRSGKPRQEIVAGLVAGGLSLATAERFVDRAIASGEQRSPEEAAAAAPDEEDAGGRRSLVGGAFWLSLGLGITGLTYVLAEPGGRYVVAYGAAIGGILAFARGLNRFLAAGRGRFPWMQVTLAALLPLLGLAGVLGYVKAKEARQRAAVEARERAARAAAAAREREARAANDRAKAAAEAAVARTMVESAGRDPAAVVAQSLAILRDPQAPPCEAAMQLGFLGAREAIPDLRARLEDSSRPVFQACVAYALVELGETEAAFAFYATAAASTNFGVRQVGLQGFGHLGPRAVPAAFPHLAAALQSRDSTDRLLAVEALRQMGPEAIPYLRTAASDADALVQQRAHRGLDDLGAR